MHNKLKAIFKKRDTIWAENTFMHLQYLIFSGWYIMKSKCHWKRQKTKNRFWGITTVHFGT